jgi:hypothetical protein
MRNGVLRSDLPRRDLNQRVRKLRLMEVGALSRFPHMPKVKAPTMGVPGAVKNDIMNGRPRGAIGMIVFGVSKVNFLPAQFILVLVIQTARVRRRM